MALILPSYNSTKASIMGKLLSMCWKVKFCNLHTRRGKRKEKGNISLQKRKIKYYQCKSDVYHASSKQVPQDFTQLQVTKHVIQRPQFSPHVSNPYN